MMNLTKLLLITGTLLLTTAMTAQEQKVLAFPGADGMGMYATGGRGGDICHVTTLEDNGDNKNPVPGSLRAAVCKKGVRTIVFDVGGQINLAGKLDIKHGNLTIAGQSAPGDGITIAGYPVFIKGSNIILRFLRFRMGDQNIDQSNFDADDGDALGCKNAKDIMIDHCSVSWSTDECASFSRVETFTMQYCIISESLKMSSHPKGNHGYGGIWGGKSVSYHHNLLAHHDSRNPRFDHQYVGRTFLGPIDYVNNVVYNWGSNSTYGGESASESEQFHVNMIGNYYKAGQNTKKSSRNRLMQLTSICKNCNKYVGKAGETATFPAKLYLEGNMVNDTNADWTNIVQDSKETRDTKSLAKLSCRWKEGLTPLAFSETAATAYQSVLSYAGASLKRDAVDERIINDVKNGTGTLINSQKDVGGYPTLDGGTAITDTDKDGIPDEWETANGLNPQSHDDGAKYSLTAKYTNLEVYLNSLVTGTFPAGANATDIK